MIRCIERATRGDESAIDAVVAALKPRLTSMAAYYARCCGEDTDDLLQEAWLGLLEALPHLNLAIGSPEQHLIQRARWRLLDAIKRAKVRRCAPLEDSAAETIPELSTEPEVEGVWVSEFRGQLSNTQQAVLGYLLDGHTWRETGSMLGCTSANIAYHVRQIRKQYVEWTAETAL